MMMPNREPMRNVDKVWLDMDSSTNLMIINGVMLFEDVIPFEQVVDIVQERLLARHVRFRQRVVRRSGSVVLWEEDPYFDLRCHVRHIALPAPGSVETLQRLISDLASEALEANRPLWRFYVIENVDGGSAVYGRIHHCIADGIALVHVLLSLTDSGADGAVHTRAVDTRSSFGSRAPGVLGRAQAMARAMAQRGASLFAGGVGVFQGEAAAALRDPARSMDLLYRAGLASLASAAIVSKLLMIPSDNDSVFKGNLGAHKRIVWSDPVELDLIKGLGRAVGATVNDVMVAALAGALRRYMLVYGGVVDVRAMIPVNLRDLNKPIKELGNQFALVYLTLPLEAASPAERIRIVKEQMDVLKQSPEPLIVYEILSLLGLLPGEVADFATTWFSSKASAVLTNVPGPRQEIYLAGRPIKRLLFWVPQTGRIGLGISIISYNGEVTIGVMVDEGLVEHPDRIVAFFREELDVMGGHPGLVPVGVPISSTPLADVGEGVASRNGNNNGGVAVSHLPLPGELPGTSELR